jgi:hypothetical protein
MSNEKEKAMATHLIKVAYEGLVTTAAKTADPGLTSGGATIYEVQDVPASVTIEEIIAAFRARNRVPPKHRDFEVKWADLAA